MTQIYQTDSALIRLLQGCNFPGVDVASGPHAWDGAYVQRLLNSTPAIRVVFLGAESLGETATTLAMAGKWSVIVITGWNGGDEASRRLGPDAALDLLARAAGALHSAVLEDDAGERLTIVDVDGIEVLSDGSADLADLYIAEIGITIELPIEIPEVCQGPLDLFLRIRGDIEVTDPADDVPLAVDLPQ